MGNVPPASDGASLSGKGVTVHNGRTYVSGEYVKDLYAGYQARVIDALIAADANRRSSGPIYLIARRRFALCSEDRSLRERSRLFVASSLRAPAGRNIRDPPARARTPDDRRAARVA